MCRNLSEGGQRCATHTRPGYQAVMGTGDPAEVPVSVLAARVDDGFDAVVDYAATRSGGRKVREDLQRLTDHYAGPGGGSSAQDVADEARVVAALDYAIRRAEARTAANKATRQAAAAPPAEPVTLRASPPFRTRQGYRQESLVEVDGRKVRLTVYRDSYDFQSRFHAEVWTGAGWQSVAHVPGDDPQGKEMPSYVLVGPAAHPDATAAVNKATQQMNDRLLSEARAVLRNTPPPAQAPVVRSDAVVVSEQAPIGNRQGYDSTRVVEVDGLKVRTRVHADTSYDFQSSLTAEVWTEGGWKQAASIHPLDPAAPKFPRAGGVAYPDGPYYERDSALAASVCATAHNDLVWRVRDLL